MISARSAEMPELQLARLGPSRNEGGRACGRLCGVLSGVLSTAPT